MQSLIGKIEKLEQKHHIIIGSILRKDDTVKFNENQTGVMINVSTIPTHLITEIESYLSYLDDQESILYKIETKKEEMKQEYFIDN